VNSNRTRLSGLPSAENIRRAVELYLEHAFPVGAGAAAQKFIPPQGFDPSDWLMSGIIEREPADERFEEVHSFALRIGNMVYPHMKLRLTRPPNEQRYILLVDTHDAFLHADAGSSDAAGLEQLKEHNATVAAAINAAWDRAGLPTEHNYLRWKIAQARAGRDRQGDQDAQEAGNGPSPTGKAGQ